MKIVISGALLRFVNYQQEHQVQASTALQGIRQLASQYPPLENALFDDSGALRKFNVVYIDKKKAASDHLDAECPDDTTVEIVTAIAGG